MIKKAASFALSEEKAAPIKNMSKMPHNAANGSNGLKMHSKIKHLLSGLPA